VVRSDVKSYPLIFNRGACNVRLMHRKTIRLGKSGCIAAMAAVVIYSFARLYVFSQRADLSILLLNVIAFGGIAGLFIYLSMKERDTEEERLFRD
jgi:hypothetical protein